MPESVTFSEVLKRIICISALFVLALLQAPAQQLFKGIILEEDSLTAMPFVYVINKNTGHGMMSDNSGRFYLSVKETDTIICSFVGYVKLKIPVKKIMKGPEHEVKIVMKQIPVNLRAVTVTAMKLKPYEREKMDKVIKDSKFKPVNAMESPITALYDAFSKKGRENRKLAAIFEQVLIDEQVQKKMSPEILRKLTGDETINYDAFRKYCYYLSDYYIINHDGYDLYYKVMECYYRWKEEHRK